MSSASFSQRSGDSCCTRAVEHRLDLEEVLKAVRETVYRWEFTSDRIDWAENAPEVLGISDPLQLAKGHAFALLVDPEHAERAMTGSPAGRMCRRRPKSDIAYIIASSPRGAAAGRRYGSRTPASALSATTRGRSSRKARCASSTTAEGSRSGCSISAVMKLTGQLNRTRLTEELTRLLSSAGRVPAKGAFLLAGVNDLTLINETYGFDVGDEVIAIVGRRSGRALRGKDCIGRFSSNKFGVVLHDCDAVGIEAIAARLMASVRDSVIDTSVGAVVTSLSIGGVLLPEQASNAQSAIGRCLDVARDNRGHRFAVYRPCERRESERRRAVGIADEIVRALNDRRMMLAL